MHTPATATLRALEDVDGMADELAAVASLLDPDSALAAAARAVRSRTGMEVGFVGTTSGDGAAVHVRHVDGVRSDSLRCLEVPAGTGLGGRVLLEPRVHRVDDYVRSHLITHEHDAAIRAEGLGAMVAVPIGREGKVRGMLYGAERAAGPIGDHVCAMLEDIAAQTAVLLDAADRARGIAEQAVAEERARLAGALHDSVGAMLFAIGAGATELVAELGDVPEVAARAQALVDRTTAARQALRRSLRALGQMPATVALGAGLQAEARACAARSGIDVRVVVLTELPELDDAVLAALIGAVRESLHNAEKHAGASSVVVTAMTARGGVAVAVADDGRGMQAATVDGGPTGQGIHRYAVELARVGGDLVVLDDEEGGVTVRSWVPA